jgi:hypothetical protein
MQKIIVPTFAVATLIHFALLLDPPDMRREGEKAGNGTLLAFMLVIDHQ